MFTRCESRHPQSAPAFSRDQPMRAVSSRASRGVLCVLLACTWHGDWGNHADGYMSEQRMPVGRWAAVSRHSPGTTFYPCQSIGGLDTQYRLRPRRKDNRSSEAPHLSKRWVYPPEPSRALQSTGKRHRCAAWIPWLPSFHATQHPLSSTRPLQGSAPLERREEG
jgi:hypothetical protein